MRKRHDARCSALLGDTTTEDEIDTHCAPKSWKDEIRSSSGLTDIFLCNSHSVELSCLNDSLKPTTCTVANEIECE